MFSLKRDILLPLLLIAPCMLLAGSTALAEVCTVPTSCVLYDANGTPSPYSLAVYPVDGKWPVPTADGKYQWIYEIKGPTNTLNQLTALAPVCCPGLGYSVLSGGQVLAPGAGDTSSPFGIGNYQAQVVRLAYSPSSAGVPANYSFLTDTLPDFRDNFSMQLKSGKNTYYCRAIAGPHCLNDCPSQVYVPVNIYEEKILGEFEVRVTRDRGSWCALIVEYFDPRPYLFDGTTPNPNYNQWVILEPEPATINGQNVVNCGMSDGNQRCQECIIFGESSPGCYTYTSGGRTYKVPTGCK